MRESPESLIERLNAARAKRGMGNSLIERVNAVRRKRRLIQPACESPIEKLLYESLLPFVEWRCKRSSFVGRVFAFDAFLQYKVGRYRVDFAFVSPTHRLAVECDGHEFHERTKGQAQRDRKRDRDLQETGWLVRRYTGSEVFNAPDAAAKDIVQFLKRLS